MEKTEFIRSPVCRNKTRDKIREDTVLKNFPLFCPKCKSECLIDIEQFHITVIEAQVHSRRADNHKETPCVIDSFFLISCEFMGL